ncbi:ABC transporter permease [Segatella oulorum]|uniref:ABC transporter permease n=1 Tax=Segatella oulorum TaxID=28136 RepID=UPI0028E3C57A|nr:ABC transporter permease [Segatella oulorum]
MNLVWKLLRQHLSIPQMAGFFFANLFGMIIVLLSVQFYQDVIPVFTAEDSFMRSDFLIVNKKIGTGSTISGSSNTFNQTEVDDLAQQPFVSRMGKFTNANYKADVSMRVNGVSVLNNGEISFESIPDSFVDTPLRNWNYQPGEKTIPIILPRIYLTMYNFGFAQTHALPKLSDGLVGMIDFHIFVHGKHREAQFKGKVIGFSNRLSSILVPQAFMDWSNDTFASGETHAPTRLIVQVNNPSDPQFTKYLDQKGYEIENDKLNTEKTTYFLRLLVMMVVGVGLVISALSFYILMLSIYLLVQKNTHKLENLLLIGYRPAQVALPYQMLTIGLNLLIYGLALLAIFFARSYYMDLIETLFPNIEDGNMLPATAVGALLFVLVSLSNYAIIARKIVHIWKRKDA